MRCNRARLGELVAGGLTVAAGTSACAAAGTAGSPALPAPEALRLALPELRQRHPASLILGLEARAGDLRGGVSSRWELSVWVPEWTATTEAHVAYRVLGGKLGGAPSTVGPSQRRPNAVPPFSLMRSTDPVPTPLVDSDPAPRSADPARIERYGAHPGLRLTHIALFRDASRSAYAWGLHYVAAQQRPAVGVTVVAQTGAVVRLEGNVPDRP